MRWIKVSNDTLINPEKIVAIKVKQGTSGIQIVAVEVEGGKTFAVDPLMLLIFLQLLCI